jgi:predicted DNA-binding transcriptional regulator YafY
MARKAAAQSADQELSPRRAARLYRLVNELAKGAHPRAKLIRMGKAGMRTFYRDLNFLLACGIDVRTQRGEYSLVTALDESLKKLPFPNPNITFADVMELARGSGDGARKLKDQLDGMA